MSKKLLLSAVAPAAILIASAAHATNGSFSHGYGAKSNGLAGAGAALPQDALAAATNPAGVVFVEDRMDLGLAWFRPMREYTISGQFGQFPPFPGDTVESGSEDFFIPNFGWNRALGEQAAFNISLYGNGGMNTDFDENDTVIPTPGGPMAVGTFGRGDVLMDYSQLFVNATYARKFNESASWGLSGILNYSRFKLDGLSGFAGFSTDPENLSNNGYDDALGFGVKLGVQGDVAPGVTLAASYQSKIENTFDDYAGLFYDEGRFDIPPTATVGVAWHNDSGAAFVFDIQHIFYSESNAIGDSSRGLLACMGGDTSQCLGGPDSAGFGWDDMTVFKAGYQWRARNDLIWRVGASYGEQPIGEDEVTFNLIAPGVVETHLTTGFTKELAGGREFNMAFMYAPENCVDGPVMFNPGQDAEICMSQFQLEGSYSW